MNRPYLSIVFVVGLIIAVLITIGSGTAQDIATQRGDIIGDAAALGIAEGFEAVGVNREQASRLGAAIIETATQQQKALSGGGSKLTLLLVEVSPSVSDAFRQASSDGIQFERWTRKCKSGESWSVVFVRSHSNDGRTVNVSLLPIRPINADGAISGNHPDAP